MVNLIISVMSGLITGSTAAVLTGMGDAKIICFTSLIFSIIIIIANLTMVGEKNA
ncbi:MAG: hypothetical protein MUO73_01995 [Thermoplasmata archaeon]|nr:hypothetical protein [Thermoplasmata archaeon]